MTEDLGTRMRAEIAAVVPCYNAGNRVRPVLEHVCGLLDHVILVDDGSSDGCVHPLRNLPVNIVHFRENQGKGHALIAGFREALRLPEIAGVCVIDADGQHDPGDLIKLFEAFQCEKADLLIGSRIFDGVKVPWRSRFGNKLTIQLTALLLGRRLPDTQCGFRILSRRYAQRVVDSVRGGRYETEMEILVRALREGFTVASTPIATIYEEGNPSSHFRKIQDSVLVYSRLLRAVMRRRG